MFATYLIALGLVVFTPVNSNSDGIFGFIHISGALEKFLNLFLLVPMAIFLWILYLRRSPMSIFAICLLTSLGIELIQLMIPGRVTDPLDVFTNITGVACALIAFKRPSLS